MKWLGGLLALLVGVSCAVAAAGAAAGGGPNEVTVFGDREEALTILGSSKADDLTVRGTAPGTITIVGDNMTESREDCTSFAGPPETVFCDPAEIRTITAPLGGGGDRISNEFLSNAIKFGISGGNGDDKIFGNQFGETLSGGPADDKIRGNGGKDKINGGKGKDDCVGGDGKDEVDECE